MIMQAVRIVEAIVAHKEKRNILPAHATTFEVYQRYQGTAAMMYRELNIAVADGILVEGRTLNYKYYKPNSDIK